MTNQWPVIIIIVCIYLFVTAGFDCPFCTRVYMRDLREASNCCYPISRCMLGLLHVPCRHFGNVGLGGGVP